MFVGFVVSTVRNRQTSEFGAGSTRGDRPVPLSTAAVLALEMPG